MRILPQLYKYLAHKRTNQQIEKISHRQQGTRCVAHGNFEPSRSFGPVRVEFNYR